MDSSNRSSQTRHFGTFVVPAAGPSKLENRCTISCPVNLEEIAAEEENYRTLHLLRHRACLQCQANAFQPLASLHAHSGVSRQRNDPPAKRDWHTENIGTLVGWLPAPDHTRAQAHSLFTHSYTHNTRTAETRRSTKLLTHAQNTQLSACQASLLSCMGK